MSSSDVVVDLGSNLFLSYAFTGRGAVAGSLLHGTTTVGSVVLDPDGHLTARVDVDDSTLRLHGEFAIDLLAGAVLLTATASMPAPPPAPPGWVTVLDVDHEVLFTFDPCVGLLAGLEKIVPPAIDPRWGPCGPSSGGIVTRIHVADDERQLTDIGRTVKQKLFADHGPFTFNVVACCGSPIGAPNGPGVYGDPDSIWFNVFYGSYQIDCKKSDGWTRPFGYESADGVASVLHAEDIVRVGKADWNWFSNYLYGVPEASCDEYSDIDMSRITTLPVETVQLGSTLWHLVTLHGIQVASCYVSSSPGAAQLVENSILTPGWRESFGLPCPPRPDHPTSFIPTTLSTSLAMTYWEDDSSYHTLMCGGTANEGCDEFLEAQAVACRNTVAGTFPKAGFSDARSDVHLGE